MKKKSKFTKMLPGIVLMVIGLLSYSLNNKVSAQTYSDESFATSLPGYSASIVGNPPVQTAPNFNNPVLYWAQNKIAGSGNAPNDFEWVPSGTNPTVTNQNIVGVPPAAFPAGAGFIRYINRSIAYGSGTSGINYAASGDSAFLATPSLDWSGRFAHNAGIDTFGLSMWRDGTAGALLTVMDGIVVYVNDQPSMVGAVKAFTVNGDSVIYRSSTQIPTLAGAAPGTATVAGAWNRYKFVIPNDARFYNATLGGTSTAYIIIAGCSAGGNNIFIDNVNLPQWRTAMQVTGVSVTTTITSDVGKNTQNNVMMGLSVITKGSIAPSQLNGILFNSAGSSNPSGDISASKVWYTGASNAFNTTGGPIQFTQVVPSAPLGPAYANANLFFGWLDGVSGCPIASVAPPTLYPGNQNYFWFVYDITAGATANNNVAVNFEQIFTSWSTASCVGDTVVTVCAVQRPLTITSFVTCPSATVVRKIDQAYAMPTYGTGTAWAGYNSNDFVSAVEFLGDVAPGIKNYYHDGTNAEILTACPNKSSGSNINRFACHPPDYTQFQPINGAPGAFRDRYVQVTHGKGVRTGGIGYTLRAQCGTWPSSNNVGVFIDWNKDGDFDDTYQGTTAIPAQNTIISESYGNKVQSNATIAVPIVWVANTTWIIDVPLISDNVVDGNIAQQPPNNSTGPIITGNVRMRVREVFAGTVTPFNSATYGETEDYTIQVLPDCPVGGSNICKWVGGTTDWSDPKNWCPTLPTKNDMAYISVGPQYMPVILDSVNAVCRTLRILPGASLGINATKGSSLTVSDDIEIGYGATSGTGANIAITSDYAKKIILPGKSQVPPLGLQLVAITPFRTNAQGKIQISYTKAELANTFFWKKGDVIDSISFEVASMNLSPALASSWQNFRIRAFSMTTAKSYPAILTTGVKVAAEVGDVDVVSVTTIYGGLGTTLTMNLPLATGGTETNGNYYTIPLIANSFIWDGNDLVLSIEYNTSAGGAPVRSYILYDENAGANRVLTLNYNTVGVTVTGWNMDGLGHYNATPGVGPGTANAGITSIVPLNTINRPRLEFYLHRDYNQFPITVGGNWINNNRLLRAAPYGTTTPVYILAGDSGFIAGNSKVTFDPSVRSGVNSPGMNAPYAPYTATTPGVTLVQDMDQEITSGVSSGGNSTIFNVVQIKKTTSSGKVVKQNGTYNPFLIGTYADTLYLTNGELMLNRKDFTLKRGDVKALTVGTGWLRSEDGTGASPGTIQSKFNWKIGSTTGVHSIPFKANGASVFNFKYDLATGDIGTISVATYGTATSNNTPYPVAPQAVAAMTTNLLPTPGADGTPWTVDRFWYVSRNTVSAVTGSMVFEYDNTEGTMTSAYNPLTMKAQRYGTTGWQAPVALQTDANLGGNLRSVTHPGGSISNTLTTWTIVNTFGTQGPLPLELINFSAKAIDRKVKIWWDVMSERDVSMYSVERTADNKTFDVIAGKSPVGPSVDLLSYEAWDNKPLNGLQYYRLATNFTDGSIDYSKLVPVRFGTDGVFAINNVITNNDATLTVNFTYDSQLPYTYMVTDMMGRVVATGENKNAAVGDNSIVIPVVLSNGIYTISLVNSEKAVSQKMFY